MKGTIKNKVYHKYEKESSRFRKIGRPEGSWTINLGWLENKEVDTIIYETKKAIYKIDFDWAVLQGKILVFQGEVKLVVPIKNWEIINK